MKIKYLLFGSVFCLFLFTQCSEKKQENTGKVEVSSNEVETKEEVINQKLTNEDQINSAKLAAPVEVRDDVTVYGYDENGDLVTLKNGDSNFICIADDPNRKGFQVVCYHKSLEPFMARGRALTKEGKSRDDKEKIREQEAISGKLEMPGTPATLHIYHGEKGFYNQETNQIENAKYRYVVYIPFATQETTGLNLKPNDQGHPWLMFPGKYNAHIMITPKN